MASPRVMLMDKPVVLQLAIRTITADIMFSNRWTSVSALEKGLTTRYKFDCDILISKKNTHRSVSKIEPSLDSLSVANHSGIYCGKYKKENYYFFQNPVSDPPYFPPPMNYNDKWKDIEEIDEQNLKEYINRIERGHQKQRSKKKRIRDDVDIYLYNSKMARQSESLFASSIDLGRILCYNYWDSPEAAKLFEPKNGNTVLSCLSKRVTLLTKVSYNDNMLTHLLIDVANINNISSHQ